MLPKLAWMRLSEYLERRPARVTINHPLRHTEHHSQSLLNGVEDSGGHLWGGVPVVAPMALPRFWPLRPVDSWPISSLMTRAGMPASSSQVA